MKEDWVTLDNIVQLIIEICSTLGLKVISEYYTPAKSIPIFIKFTLLSVVVEKELDLKINFITSKIIIIKL